MKPCSKQWFLFPDSLMIVPLAPIFRNAPLKAVLYVCWALEELPWGRVGLFTPDKLGQRCEVRQDLEMFLPRKYLCVGLT